MNKTPVTVVTGALGSGKTTIIRNVISQLPAEYKVVWLKNEYGDMQIDTELAHQSNIKTKEILNGCLCCVLVGKLLNALEEIVQTIKPDRIIIETAGTAYPAPIIHEIQKVAGISHDGLVLIIDCLNFKKFEDKSYAARTQVSFVDLVVLNKLELVTEDELYKIEDEIYDLYLETPKYKAFEGKISKDLLFGIDVKQVLQLSEHEHRHIEDHIHTDEVEVFTMQLKNEISKNLMQQILSELDPESFYRIKGIVKDSEGFYLLNYVLGRITFESLNNYAGGSKLVFMGKDIVNSQKELEKKLQRF